MTSISKLILLLVLVPGAAYAAPVRENWDNLCAKCHGPNGEGNTKEGAKRTIKDYTNPKVQSEFTDAGLLKNLMLGIKSSSEEERMPSYKDKLTVAEAKELVALIRSFKKGE